jgi:hypothetical protein
VPVVGEAKELELALTDKKISQLPELSTIESLRYCMVLIGLRESNWPTKEETAVLLTYIKKYYSGHTPSEIRLAFEMAIDGKLNCEVKHYENFSVMYFAGVMNAYRKWAKDEIKQLPPPKVEQKLAPVWQLDLEIAVNNLKLINKLPVKSIQ